MHNDASNQIPHLKTAVSGPLFPLEKSMLENQSRIEAWFTQQWRRTHAPFYASVDLRNSGFRLAPVDTNLFPAGFNNLNPDFFPSCIQAVKKLYFSCKRILIIPESHSRNIFYLENVAVIAQILNDAGYDTRIGSLMEELNVASTINLPSGKSLTLQPVIRTGKRIGVEGFDACAILLNHDLSEGVPKILQQIEQPFIPPLNIGWANRLKSNHFAHYEKITNEFAKLIDIDPWLITPSFHSCDKIDFMSREGIDCLFHYAKKIYQSTFDKYQTYGIDRKPFIVIKADAGTYGMSVMMTEDPEKICHLNRKERAQMAKSKGGQKVEKVIVQEGIHTVEMLGEEQAIAEPVIYMIGSNVVGGFYRVHAKKGSNENLNAPGMHFAPMRFAETDNNPDDQAQDGKNRFYAYAVVARLALLAAAREVAEVEE